MSDLAGSTRQKTTQSARVAAIGGGIVGARQCILAVLCFDTGCGHGNLAVTNRRQYTMA